MKRKILFILCVVFIAVSFVSAQNAKKVVTNADLDRFKQKRLQAEKDLRENYEKLGFPSPEELEIQRKASDIERKRVAEKLRRERLEREQLRLEQQYLQSQNMPDIYLIQNSTRNRSYPYFYNYAPRYFGKRFRQNYDFPLGGGYFGPTFNPNQGVRINTTGIQINTLTPIRPPVRIRNPR